MEMNIYQVESVTFAEPAHLSTGSIIRTIRIKHKDGEFRLTVFSTYRECSPEERMACVTPYFKADNEA